MNPFSTKRVKFVLLQCIGYLLLMFPLAVLIPKEEMTLMINNWVMNQEDTWALDSFFKYITHLGDGLMIGVWFVIFLFFRLYYGMAVLGTGLVHLIFIFVFKKLIFNGMKRPWGFFEDDSVLHAIEGVKQHKYNTFPSGHTATAFAIATLLALTVPNRKWVPLIILLAAVVGFSRVYLNQHFLIDTYVGAVVGMVSTFIVWMIFEKWTSLHQQPWINWTVTKRK